jgi:hypothetical protein
VRQVRRGSLPSFLSRTPGAEHHYSAERHDDPAVILTAADLGALRELIRADYLSRPVPPGGYPANGPGHPARNQAAMPAEPAAVGPPEHPLYALTTYELKDRRRELERAIKGIAVDAPIQADVRRALDAVIAEQEDRARSARA